MSTFRIAAQIHVCFFGVNKCIDEAAISKVRTESGTILTKLTGYNNKHFPLIDVFFYHERVGASRKRSSGGVADFARIFITPRNDSGVWASDFLSSFKCLIFLMRFASLLTGRGSTACCTLLCVVVRSRFQHGTHVVCFSCARACARVRSRGLTRGRCHK